MLSDTVDGAAEACLKFRQFRSRAWHCRAGPIISTVHQDPNKSLGRMSAFGGKVDMAVAYEMSAFTQADIRVATKPEAT
jgi:hypothetical protein